MNSNISRVIKSMHMQIERGLRKSVDALHALAEKCKKKIEIQKARNTNKVCNHSCSCLFYESASTSDTRNNNNNALNKQLPNHNTDKKKKKNKRKKQNREAQLQQQNANLIIQQIQHQKQQEYQQQQIQIQRQTWLQQQYQYELQKQNQIQQQMRINQIQTKYNPNMASMQQTQPNNRYQPQQSPNCPENPNQSSSAAEIIIQKMTKMIEDLEDRLTTYSKCLSYHKAGTFQCPMHKNEIQRLQAKTNGNGKNSEIFNMDKLNEILEEHTDKLTTYTRCMVFDKQVNYKNHSELEKAIFHKTLNHVKEIKDPLIEEEFEKAVEEIMEIAVRMKAKEA